MEKKVHAPGVQILHRRHLYSSGFPSLCEEEHWGERNFSVLRVQDYKLALDCEIFWINNLSKPVILKNTQNLS